MSCFLSINTRSLIKTLLLQNMFKARVWYLEMQTLTISFLKQSNSSLHALWKESNEWQIWNIQSVSIIQLAVTDLLLFPIWNGVFRSFIFESCRRSRCTRILAIELNSLTLKLTVRIQLIAVFQWFPYVSSKCTWLGH